MRGEKGKLDFLKPEMLREEKEEKRFWVPRWPTAGVWGKAQCLRRGYER